MAGLTLGLDVGSNSLGWALIDESLGVIHGTGVRVFPEGVDREATGAEVSKNAQRRVARGMRRQIARRARRKRQLRRELVAAGLLPGLALQPPSGAERRAWEQEQFRIADPYTLRKRAAAGERLAPFDLGRVLLHLGQRRGFLSNRKADKRENKDNSEILKEISELAAQMGDQTLGAYLSDQRGEDPTQHHLTRIRGHHTRRDMYESEFDVIWTVQQSNHPTIMTDVVRKKIRQCIFFQRPLLPPSASLIGRCELESRLPRCPRADRRAQKFRMYQEVNNLRVIDTAARCERPLSSEERQKLIRYLASAEKRTFDQIRKHLFKQSESILFNLERGGRSKLDGLSSDATLAHKTLFGKRWEQVPEEIKDRIVAAIIDDNVERLREALSDSGESKPTADVLLDSVNFIEGYSSYSLHAIKKLLPSLERRLPLTSRTPDVPCALREAGYLMPWEHVPGSEPFLPEPPRVTNPLVRQALHEVRKVVNAILRELIYRHGHTLQHIRLELAREVRGTAKQRAQRTLDMRSREVARDRAADRIRELGNKPTRDAIDRYLLWQEQGETCVYSGRPISMAQLFAGEVDIDHILPYSRSLDNSLMNKVVGFRNENAAKGNRTPHEWLAAISPPRYEEILLRARKLPYPKSRRFFQETLDLDDFFARQFVDTTYITTQVFDYVRCLGADVLCPKGQHTAELRHLWGLDTILRDLRDAPAWAAAVELPPGEKNRLDHRHHAVDALVIALTNPSQIRLLAARRYLPPGKDVGPQDLSPWAGFRVHVAESLRAINVSHRVRRKIAGALHEDTVYGPTRKSGEVVVRKMLTALTCSMVPDIRDATVRQKVIDRLKSHGIEVGRGQDVKIPTNVWKEPLWMNEEKQIPIRRVRLIRREQTVLPIRGRTAYVKPGNTHHLCIFERVQPDGKKKLVIEFVTVLEALARVKRHEPIVQRVHPEFPDARFIMSLSGSETVLLEHSGATSLYRFDTAAATSKQMWFRHHTAGGKSSLNIGRVSKKPGTLSVVKVTVDPIGQIRYSHD